MLASRLSAMSKVRTEKFLMGFCRRQLNGNSPTFYVTPKNIFPLANLFTVITQT